MSEISLSFEFIDKYVRFAKPEYVQIYIYIKYYVAKNGNFPETSEIASALGILPAKAEFVLEYWKSCGELVCTDGVYSVKSDEKSELDIGLRKRGKKDEKEEKEAKKSLVRRVRSMKPAYSQEEIDAVATANKQISGLFYQAEKILSKVLTASDMELLFSFNDWLGLPVEVILMLLMYAAKKGKTTKRYLETVAIDWAEKGIDTFEAAEAYVSELEAADSAERSVRNILGIYDRGLTATEKKYIKLWVKDMKITPELISLAYDRTVEYTGKLSWSYMDKMLRNWLDSGLEDTAGVKAADEEFYKKSEALKKKDSKVKKISKFNNYEDSNSSDYAELEEQILDMMLDDNYK